jgi:mono/diheme cytochrome c family protein
MKGVERLAAALLWLLPAMLVLFAGYLDIGTPRPEPAPAPTPASPGVRPVTAADLAAGQQLYDASCAGCHTIGGGATVGPDLARISDRRPREFIIRYTFEPDVVQAEGHPVAIELAAAYSFPMPNVGVTRAEAEQILAFIDQRSADAAP